MSSSKSKNSCIVIAILEIIFSLYNIFSTVIGGLECAPEWDCNSLMTIIMLANISQIVFSSIMLHGVVSESPKLILAWLIYNFIVNILLTISFFLTSGLEAEEVAVIVISRVIEWGFWGGVYKYYKELKNELNVGSSSLPQTVTNITPSSPHQYMPGQTPGAVNMGVSGPYPQYMIRPAQGATNMRADNQPQYIPVHTSGAVNMPMSSPPPYMPGQVPEAVTMGESNLPQYKSGQVPETVHMGMVNPPAYMSGQGQKP